MGYGEYPPEYNRSVHGIYDPSRWYGKPDTPLSQVKLCELGGWFGRRSFKPQAMSRALSRGYWRWLHKFFHARKSTYVPFAQLAVSASVLAYILNYPKYQAGRAHKYHW